MTVSPTASGVCFRAPIEVNGQVSMIAIVVKQSPWLCEASSIAYASWSESQYLPRLAQPG